MFDSDLISRSVSDRSVFFVVELPKVVFLGALSVGSRSALFSLSSFLGALFVTPCTITPNRVQSAITPK